MWEIPPKMKAGWEFEEWEQPAQCLSPRGMSRSPFFSLLPHHFLSMLIFIPP